MRNKTVERKFPAPKARACPECAILPETSSFAKQPLGLTFYLDREGIQKQKLSLDKWLTKTWIKLHKHPYKGLQLAMLMSNYATGPRGQLLSQKNQMRYGPSLSRRTCAKGSGFTLVNGLCPLSLLGSYVPSGRTI